MSEQNKQVALKFIEAMGTNDPVAAGECFADDGFALAKGTTRFAGKRSRQMIVDGIEAFKALLPDGLRFEIKSVTAEGDRVAVEAEGNGVAHDGTPYRNQYCFVVTLKGGKIVQANEYFCTKLADQVLWPLAEKMHALGETQG
jgi:ketosteroid isomerase-like protein